MPLKGKCLPFRSEGLLGQRQTPVDVDNIHKARDFVRKEMAIALKDDFIRHYNKCLSNEPYQYTTEAVGRRRLKNVALGYLMEIADDEITALCLNQFNNASNMTDEIAAFSLLVSSDANEREQVIESIL